MKHKYLKLLLAMLMGMAGLDAAAYDIAVENEDGVTIYYNFINEGTELSVTQGNGVVEDFYSNDYSGSVVIPASVSYNDREYDVTAIDDWAFHGCSNLSGPVIFNTNDVSWLKTLVFDNCVPELGTMVINDAYGKAAMDVYCPAYAYDYYSTNLLCPIGSTFHPQIKIDREWTTYCATASFDVPDGIEAYVVKDYEDGVVTLKKVTTINEGEGLLLRPAEVGTFCNATLNGAPTAYESNLMKGVTEATDIEATDGELTNFIFTNGSSGLGFYPTNGGTMPAYKAYLQLPTASLSEGARKGISIAFEDDDTAISAPTVADGHNSGTWYTLGGQATGKPVQKGLYIHNNKKGNVK